MNSGWTMLWGGLLAATLVAYTILTVVVTLGGWKDIRAMFRNLRDSDDE